MTDNKITVIIPTSPIPRHPYTDIIEKVVASIQNHLSESRILILCDGVRPQMEHRRSQYFEYLQNLMALSINKWKNVQPLIFAAHLQQAGMMKAVISKINTPLLFFCEHDATIDDKFIDWDGITYFLTAGDANTVRLYWNACIHPEHVHLMGPNSGDFVRTTQWSSWPHISRVDFYERMLAQYFHTDDKKMIETVMYSPVSELPWEEFRTYIYCPESDGVRFHHLDGRTDEKTGLRDPGEW